MHPDLEEKLAVLPIARQVFVSRAPGLESENWKEYQEKELAYWQKNCDKGYYPDYRESFYRTLLKFGIKADYFSDKKVLEVGCGPQGFSASLVQLAEKQPETLVIVDSLLDKYQDFPTFSLYGNKAIKIAALGEHIPVPRNFFDITVCQNVLDHVNKPSLVISEIQRTLRKGGVALIAVHTLSPFFKLFGPMIEKLDKNHPHHFTHNDVLHLFNEFEIIRDNSQPLYKDNPNITKDRSKSAKTFLAMRFLNTTYLKARKFE